jgi:hypothetical protein
MSQSTSLLGGIDRLLMSLSSLLWRTVLTLAGLAMLGLMLLLGLAVALGVVLWALLRGRRPAPWRGGWPGAARGGMPSWSRPGSTRRNAGGQGQTASRTQGMGEVIDVQPLPPRASSPSDDGH